MKRTRRSSTVTHAIALAATVVSACGDAPAPDATPGGAPVARAADAATPVLDGGLPPLPTRLADTGLYADWGSRTVAPANRPFTPQYPLWTDGATKRRFVFLPPDARIDTTDVDAWQLPVGTKLWKEFAFGRPVETRYMERTAAGWRYATYVWTPDGADAVLASPAGARVDAEVAPGLRHAIPSEAECRLCHANGATPVLGFSALQLSPDRDPNAPHREAVADGALDLDALRAEGWIRDWPAALAAPKVPGRTPVERAALGYLHGNCGSCHREDGPIASLGLVLAQPVAARADATPHGISTTVGRASRYRPPGAGEAPVRVARGEPERSVLVHRLGARTPSAQMPPFGTQRVDTDALELVAGWIDQLADLEAREASTRRRTE